MDSQKFETGFVLRHSFFGAQMIWRTKKHVCVRLARTGSQKYRIANRLFRQIPRSTLRKWIVAIPTTLSAHTQQTCAITEHRIIKRIHYTTLQQQFFQTESTLYSQLISPTPPFVIYRRSSDLQEMGIFIFSMLTFRLRRLCLAFEQSYTASTTAVY